MVVVMVPARRAIRACLVAIAAGLLGLTPASAQASSSVSLTVSSPGTAFPLPTLVDYGNGYIDNPVALTFSGTLRGPNNGTGYLGTVELCAVGAELGGGKPLSDLLWRPSDLSAPFRPIIQGCEGAVNPARVVGTYLLDKQVQLRTYSGGVLLRLLLRWTDTADSYGTALGMAVSIAGQ